MKPDWMEQFESTYRFPNDPTYFIHSASEEWRPRRGKASPHPTVNHLKDPPAESFWLSDGVRAHSCVSSHMLSLFWAGQGFIYESNTVRLFDSSIQASRSAWGLWDVPIFYMENMDIALENNWPRKNHKALDLSLILSKVSDEHLQVFDFHPLHIALNTRSFEDYQRKKLRILGGENPWKCSSGGWGVRSLFEELVPKLEQQTSMASMDEYLASLEH
jgi:hypothetical protein